MKRTNTSTLARIIALMLCLIMSAGIMTSCLLVENSDNKGEEDKSEGTDPVIPDTDDGDPNDLFSASASISVESLIYGTLRESITIGNDDGIRAELPVSVKIADGAKSLDLSVKLAETSSDIVIGEGETAKSFDVHIEGISADNTVPMIVNLGAVVAMGLGETELKLYHIEDGTPTLMTRVGDASDFAIHNQYTYNPETGEISIFVATFSVFSAVEKVVDIWDGEAVDSWYDEAQTEFTINSAAQFAGFRDLVDEGTTFEGKTVKLGKDIDLNKIQFDPIGFGYAHQGGQVFMGIFDGQGHTIYNLAQNCWELDPDKTSYSTYTYSTAGGGLFASIKDSTIKNLAVSGADIVFECIDMGIVVGYAQGVCHFENIIVTDSKIANYNRATGGVVGEVCFGPYGTDISKGYSHTFKNITVDSSVTVSSLWGSFDTLCGGVIGGKWGDATVKMDSVTVACKLDVFSDVTAAYRWYAYRRCGMLIGNTEQSSPKKATQAAAPFLTCENVNVYYGDWVDYNYYEFATQDSGTGQRYPWVRAEAGLNNEAFSNPRYGVPTFDGVKITLENADKYKSDYTKITFNQLYGGGQGVYGCANHDGVTVTNGLKKTVYVENDYGWSNLKLEYWYLSGEDVWTTVGEDGITMERVEDSDTYKIEIPIYANSFKISGINSDGGAKSVKEVLVSEVENNETYKLSDWHEHAYSSAVTEPTCTADGYTTYTCDDCGHSYTADEVDALGHDEIIDSAKEPTCSESGLTEGSHCDRCGETIVEQQEIPATGKHNYVEGWCDDCGAFDESLKDDVDDEGWTG